MPACSPERCNTFAPHVHRVDSFAREYVMLLADDDALGFVAGSCLLVIAD